MPNNYDDKYGENGSDETEFLKDPHSEEAIDEAIQESIDEANAESITELIEEVLEVNLVETGCKMLTREALEDQEPEPKEDLPQQEKPKVGSDGSGQSHHSSSKDAPKSDKEFSQPTGPAKAPSKREKLEATKLGLMEFIENEKSVLESKNLSEKDKFYHEHLINKAQMKTEEIKSKLHDLPHDEQSDIESLPEWMQDFARAEERNKQAALDTAKDTAASGMEFNGNYGMNAMGEIAEEQDRIIREARRASEQMLGTNQSESREQSDFEDTEPEEELEEDLNTDEPWKY